MTYPGQPDWDNNALSLGRPNFMNTPTLIEWIQRQLETLEETQARLDEMYKAHKEWHSTTSDIYSCCMSTGPGTSTYVRSFGVVTPNESRLQLSPIARVMSDPKLSSISKIMSGL